MPSAGSTAGAAHTRARSCNSRRSSAGRRPARFERAAEDPNQAAPDGETALTAACARGFEAVAMGLVTLGADPGMLCHNGSSALSTAAYVNSMTPVRMLLRHGGERMRQVAAQHGLEQLLHAARVGLEVDRLLTYAKQPFGCDPFKHLDHVMRALQHQTLCEELASWFAQQTLAEVGSRDGHASKPARPSGKAAGSGTSSTSGTSQSASSTAGQQAKPDRLTDLLMALVRTGNVEELRQAFELGADINATADDKSTLLMIAAETAQTEVVQLLLSAGNHCCDLERRNAYDYTALHYASSSGHDGIVRQLIAAGSDVNAQDCKDATPLLLACLQGHREVVDSLLAAGADVSLTDCHLVGALRHAAFGGHMSIMQALLKAGDNINGGACATHSVTLTPLGAAIVEGHLHVLQFLLSHGANPNLADASGLTALSWADYYAASDRSFQPICKALLQAGAKAAPSVQDVMRRVAAQQRLTMDVQATTHDLLNALVPDSLRQRALAQLAEVRRVLNVSAGRAKRRGAASSSAQGGPMAVGSAASTSAAAGASLQVIRSSEQADRIAAELLAEEEAEKAMVQAAQAKKGKNAKKKAQAQARQQASGAGIEAAGTSGVQQQQQRMEQQQQQQEREQEQQQGQQLVAIPQQHGLGGATAGTASASACRACPGTPAEQGLTSPMAALSLGSAPAPLAPWPAATIATLNVQQQPTKQPGNASHNDDERYCVVCMDGPRCMVLCQACYEAVQETSNECPMCRCVIDVAVTLNL